MNSDKAIKKEEWLRIIFFNLALIGLIVISAILFLPDYWYLWLIIVLTGLYLIVKWHTIYCL